MPDPIKGLILRLPDDPHPSLPHLAHKPIPAAYQLIVKSLRHSATILKRPGNRGMWAQAQVAVISLEVEL